MLKGLISISALGLTFRASLQGKKKKRLWLSKHKKMIPHIPGRDNQVKQYGRMDLPALQSDDNEKLSPAAPVSGKYRQVTAGSWDWAHIQRAAGEGLWIRRSQKKSHFPQQMLCYSCTLAINFKTSGEKKLMINYRIQNRAKRCCKLPYIHRMCL